MADTARRQPRSSIARGSATIAVIIPCYREVTRIMDVLEGIGEEVSHIFVVDDACPEGTGEYVRAHSTDERVEVMTHSRNAGVGGATMTGYRRALDVGADVLVKLDGDGQMDPALIPALTEPVLGGRADYAKGNRFSWIEGFKEMPTSRIIGNLALSFMTKVSSGYWDIFDPTNGFTAIEARVCRRLPLEKISPGYFFESDVLFRLYLLGVVVEDVPMRARYGDEKSGLGLFRAMFEFTAKHYANAARRILYSYFLRDLGIASMELVVGKLSLLFGIVFGALEWHESGVTGVPATAGTVILAALPVIVGVQLLLAFLHHDARSVPRTPIHPKL